MITCSVDGCHKPSKKGGLCWGHAKRRTRPTGPPVSAALRAYDTSSWEWLTETALAYADADANDDAAFQRAGDLLRKAALAYASDCKAK